MAIIHPEHTTTAAKDSSKNTKKRLDFFFGGGGNAHITISSIVVVRYQKGSLRVLVACLDISNKVRKKELAKKRWDLLKRHSPSQRSPRVGETIQNQIIQSSQIHQLKPNQPGTVHSLYRVVFSYASSSTLYPCQ